MRYRRFCFGLLILMAGIQVADGQMPFSKGVNLTNWFQTSSAQQIQFTKFTKQDFINIRSLGCDVIRLPINLHAMTSGEPDYILDPLFLTFLDSAVAWAEDLQIHLLLDNHTFDPAVDTDPEIGPVLVKVWTQMAGHYKDRSEYIYYEVLNEPHGILDKLWGQIQQSVIDAIRSVDSVHTIVVGPAGWNGYRNLNAMPVYKDTNLIYTFHFYDPFMFSHQGASWTDPSMVPLAGVPFPYDSARMPACPDELKGTWIESGLNNYENDGTIETVKNLLWIPVSFMNNRKVPLFCGEFGIYMPNSDEPDRVVWYEVVSEYLTSYGIAWTMWDYTGGFGLFKEGTGEMFEYDVNIPLIEAVGLIPPEQTEFNIKPDSTGFNIYFDYIAEKISESSWTGNGNISFYNQDNPWSGNYCMSWSDGDRYTFVGFDFKPDKDLSYLVNNGYVVNFSVRGNTAGARFDIRFLDTKTTDPGDHPWRMAYTINGTVAPWDGEWHPVSIPLSSFTERGSWDNNTWYDPIGAFDWSSVDRFEIVAEYSSMDGVVIDFDNLRVTNTPLSVIDKLQDDTDETSIRIFPNPVAGEMNIAIKNHQEGPVEISLYNMLGQSVATLFNGNKASGDFVFSCNLRNINGVSVTDGIYFCRISRGGRISTHKIVVSGNQG